MSVARYVMKDQVRHKVADIMASRQGRAGALEEPGWIALAVLLAACNLMAVSAMA